MNRRIVSGSIVFFNSLIGWTEKRLYQCLRSHNDDLGFGETAGFFLKAYCLTARRRIS